MHAEWQGYCHHRLSKLCTDFIISVHMLMLVYMCSQAWVDFYLLGNDGGFSQTPKKMIYMCTLSYTASALRIVV